MRRGWLWFVAAVPFLLNAGQMAAADENRQIFDGETVSGWADPLFSRALAERRYSGAVVTVVQGGRTVFARGYGHADLKSGEPVDPAHTRFRIGSATKTFTATAIAQLLDRGLIASLDDPANLYLKRDQLPAVDGRAITLRDLITHRGGFASRSFGIGTDRDFDLPLTAREVAAQRPPVVRPAGERAVYSNYTTALLGIIVEDVTGQRIDDYFEAHIFAPLGMDGAKLNVTSRPPERLAQPYAYFPNGEPVAVPHWAIHPFFAPVGAINATAHDMAQFMITQLDGAQGRDTALGIRPETFGLLHGRMAGNHPAVQGFGMIFMTMDWAGHPTFGHGGNWPGFHSIMWHMPEDDAAVFISLMAEAPQPGLVETLFGSARMQPDPDRPVGAPLTNVGVLIDFLSHFYGPDTPPATLPDRADVADIAVADLVGHYRHEYRGYGTVEEILDFLNGPMAMISVTRAPDSADAILINGAGPYEQVGPGVFWNGAMEAGVSSQFLTSPLWAFGRFDGDGRLLAT
ncbi:MAG: serine hydrolase domain-containing protein, partial [Sphingomonadales bacterium]